MTTIASVRAAATPRDDFVPFIRLELRRILRDRRYIVLAIGFPVIFYLLYTGILSGASAPSDAIVGGLPWATYFMVSMAAYGAIGASLSGSTALAAERASGWTRQLRVTPLAPSSYVVGKVVVSLLVTVPAVAAVVLAGTLIQHVTLPVGVAIQLLPTLAIGAVPFAALGILLGLTFDASSAQGATMLTYLGVAVLGGLWAPISSFPDGLATIGRMLPSFRLADLGRSVAGGGGIDPMDLLVLLGYAILIGALTAWRYRHASVTPHG
jgi:ABC-2 type transport system permease protein